LSIVSLIQRAQALVMRVTILIEIARRAVSPETVIG